MINLSKNKAGPQIPGRPDVRIVDGSASSTASASTRARASALAVGYRVRAARRRRRRLRPATRAWRAC